MKIGVINTSSPLAPPKLTSGLDKLTRASNEYHIFGDPSSNYGDDSTLVACGSAGDRITWLTEVATNTAACDLIISARGGYGSLEILPKLHATELAQAKTPLCGFSDFTAILLGLHSLGRREGLWHGPALLSLAVNKAEQDFVRLCNFIENPTEELLIVEPEQLNFDYLVRTVEGELLVGNLSMLAALCGSGFVQVQAPSILCIEDIGEEPYRIHRYLMQLELSGLFAQTVAVIAGDFSRCLPSHGKGPAGEEVVKQYFRDKKIPLVTRAPFGHGDVNRPIPIGVPAQLSKQDGLLARMG